MKNDLNRLGVALQIEELTRRLEATIAEQNNIISELLLSVQAYADSCVDYGSTKDQLKWAEDEDRGQDAST